MVEATRERHILLSNMGANAPRPTTYELDNKKYTCQFSAVALWALLPDDRRPAEIHFLLTPEAGAIARKHIDEEAKQAGVSVQFIELLGNDTPDDSHAFLERVAEHIPQDCRLTLDVTQGLRHHAFLFYALALYLSEFRNVDISGAWYCRWEIARDDGVPRPFIDLKPVLDLAYWFHALAAFRETGSLREIARRMPNGELRQLIEQLSLFFVNGLPIEAGNVASRLVESAHQQRLVADVPLAEQLHQRLLSEIQPLAGPIFEAQPNLPEKSKKAIALTDHELQRQARFIDRYFETGQLNLAFGLLREWIINRLAAQSRSETWLDRPSRESIEHSLGGLGEVIKAKDPSDPRRKRYRHEAIRDTLSEDQKEWAKRWTTVADIRNALQHHGMKPATFEPQRRDIQTAKDDWQQRDRWSMLRQIGGGKGTLLICPIGLTPGVLYSAVIHTRPDRAIVICSEQSASAIDKALAKADSKTEIMQLKMRDIHRGVAEFESLINEASQWLFDADGIQASHTGGTSLMGVLVTRLVARARREYQRPVHEFVLIDPRSSEEQRSDPWQKGDIHYLK